MSSSLGVQLVTWSGTIIVMRFLLPEDYGVLTAGSILLNLGDQLSEIGIGRALVRKPELEPGDLDEAFTLGAIFSAAIYGLIFLASVPAGIYFRNPAVPGFLQVAALAILLTPFRSVGMALLERQLRFDLLSAIQVVTALVQAVLVLILAYGGWGYWSMAIGMLAARSVATVAMFGWTNWRPKFRRLGRTSSYLIRFGANATGSILCWQIYSTMDYLILGRVADPIILGYYTVGFTLMTMPVDRLTMACTRVSTPILSRLQHDPQRMWDWYLRLTGLVALVALPTLVGMVLVASDAIPLILGEKWRPSILSFQILSVAGAVMAVANPLTTMLNILNRPELNFKFAFVCLVVMAPAFALLGSAYGAVGIALAWSVFFPILAFGRIELVRPVTGMSLAKFLGALAPAVRGLLVMVPLVLLANALVGGAGSSWLRLVIGVGTGILGYSAAIWTFEQSTVVSDLRIAMREFRSR